MKFHGLFRWSSGGKVRNADFQSDDGVAEGRDVALRRPSPRSAGCQAREISKKTGVPRLNGAGMPQRGVPASAGEITAAGSSRTGRSRTAMFTRAGVLICGALAVVCLTAAFREGENLKDRSFAQNNFRPQRRGGFSPGDDRQNSQSSGPLTNFVSIKIEGDFRLIRANGIPDHPPGTFPNAHNPNRVSSQTYNYRVPLHPQVAAKPTTLRMQPFGIAVNGVVFDPFAAEWWDNDPNSGWQFEPLGGAIDLGVDQYNAHVQPNGAYHYHAIPVGLLKNVSAGKNQMSLIGWAADGFPIYGPWSYSDAKNTNSTLKKLKSGYRVKNGTRPSGPGGKFDGSFVADYEWAKGVGDLDECNGRFGVTPEFPQGTYYYVLTEQFPFIPRQYKGTPDSSFARRGPPGGGRRGPGGFRPQGRPDGQGGDSGRPGGGPPQGRQFNDQRGPGGPPDRENGNDNRPSRPPSDEPATDNNQARPQASDSLECGGKRSATPLWEPRSGGIGDVVYAPRSAPPKAPSSLRSVGALQSGAMMGRAFGLDLVVG